LSLLRFLGIAKPDAAPSAGETRTVREIAAKLERLPPETARFLAGFAYVLARVANADLVIADAEAEEMRSTVSDWVVERSRSVGSPLVKTMLPARACRASSSAWKAPTRP